jgi:hypothetical protein
LPVYEVKDDRVANLQRELLALFTRTGVRPAARDDRRFVDLLMALRLAVLFGWSDLLGYDADPELWAAFSIFQRIRDEGGYGTYRQIARRQPGPMLMAAAMIIASGLRANWTDDPVRAASSLHEYFADHPNDVDLWVRVLLATEGFHESVTERLDLQPRSTWLGRGLPNPGGFPIVEPTGERVARAEWALSTHRVTPDSGIPLVHLLYALPSRRRYEYSELVQAGFDPSKVK